jgi:hypothetical protein
MTYHESIGVAAYILYEYCIIATFNVTLNHAFKIHVKKFTGDLLGWQVFIQWSLFKIFFIFFVLLFS